jgi:hypothetical protein
MIHYSCDLCGARIEPGDPRFVVKTEVYAAADEQCLSFPDDPDQLEQEFEELTEALADADPDFIEDATYRGFRFDLCPRCHKRYLNDPLFRAVKKRIDFSDN